MAEEVAVPVGLQAELLVKAAAYDRHLPARAGATVVVVVLVKPGSGDSERVAAQITSALGAEPTIARLRHREEVLSFTNVAAMVAACGKLHPSIIYVTPGFSDEIPAIAQALRGADVLTVAAMPSYVSIGIVLGFDIQSGRPKLVVHLKQAKEQHVEFDAAFLELARLVTR
jgi:hypothetical protein